MFHIFILNEKSLRGRLYNCREDIKGICENNGLHYKTVTTRSVEELKYEVKQYAAHDNVVYYAVGGDGTFQVLVNAVDLENAVLQYLPYGSGNNAYLTFYNKSFDLKRDILSAETFKADLGQANGEYFITMFGLALDAKIGYNLARFKRFPIPGKAKYYMSILYTLLFQRKPVKIKLTAGGESKDITSSFISITNGATIGGQTPISPYSSAFDGKLNAVICDKVPLSDLLKLFSSIDSSGKHLNSPHVTQYLFEELSFENENDNKLMYEIDGEIRHASRIDIKACKDAITLKGIRKI